ncbi:MAG: translation elongation factor Ts [Gammaproteobacteria bacterium]|nr:translation elongation factor Ts [Gammaproteobacteria bacterium]
MSDNTKPITAALVAELRALTDAPMMDCKRALTETGGDIEKAIEAMRKSGAAKAAKRQGNTTAEGIIAIETDAANHTAAMAEINSETDFVARAEDFQQFAQQVAKRALETKVTDVAALSNLPYEAGHSESIEIKRQHLIAKIGENITIRRVGLIHTDHIAASYSHGSRIGVLVELQGGSVELGKDMAMQIAASRPEVVSPEQVSAELIAKERDIFIAQAAESGKPRDIIDKMVNGRITKFLDEVSLVGQPFVKDPDMKVGAVLKKANAQVVQFIRFEVGEGIAKKVDNFVEEVMAQARGK